MLMNYDIDEISPTNKRNIEECFILGKLADENANLPNLGIERKPVSYTTFNSVVFYIQACSDEPTLLKELIGKRPEDVYITFDNKNKLYLRKENYENEDDKISFLLNHFKDKLILFKPKLTYDRAKRMYHYNFDIILVEDEEVPSPHYVAIPHIQKGISHRRFEKLLLEKIAIELEQYNHCFDIPEFIVCDNYIYHIPDVDVLEKYKSRSTTYICQKPEEIKRIPLPQEWQDSMAKMTYKNLCFISTKSRHELNTKFDEIGESIPEIYKKQVNEEVAATIEKEETETKKEHNTTTQDTSSTIASGQFLPEYKFLDYLHSLALERELIYDQNDLKNLHISLKTSNFTILGGMSGTGKFSFSFRCRL